MAAPPIDTRTEADIAEQVRKLLAIAAPGYKPGDPLGESLIAVFSRYAEVIIDRLNRAPDRSLLAFLDLVGASLLPPRPARVPLVFSLAKGAMTGVVLAGTQVGALPPAGSPDPVIFETENPLGLVAGRLDNLYLRNKPADTYRVLNAVTGVPASTTDPLLPHELYLAADGVFGWPNVNVGLNIQVTNPPPATLGAVLWERWDGAAWVAAPVSQANDPEVVNLAAMGTLLFDPMTLNAVDVGSHRRPFLRARTNVPLDLSTTKRPPTLTSLPSLNLSLAAAYASEDVRPEAAFANDLPVDLTAPFFPFGQRPRSGDTFSFAIPPAWARKTVQVTLTFGDPAQAAGTSASASLICECWTGSWANLALTDGTNAFKQAGEIQFTLPADLQPTVINGRENRWARLRLQGDYGTDAYFSAAGQWVAATLQPPRVVLQGSRFIANLAGANLAGVDLVLASNDFRTQEILAPGSSAIVPFNVSEQDVDVALHFPVRLPPGGLAFPPAPLSMFIGFDQAAARIALNAGAKPSWQYWNAAEWSQLTTNDGTEGLRRTGTLEFLPPADWSPREDFGLEPAWYLRAAWTSAPDQVETPTTVLLNGVMGTQETTVRGEVLGSSTGVGGQAFRVSRTPVLPGQQLVVVEPQAPSASDLEGMQAEEGPGLVQPLPPVAGAQPAFRVRWHEVPDFYASGPRDRHYLLDHVSGALTFGDGQSGLIPPPGAGNIQLARYGTGGGSSGNVAGGSATQLKTTIPFVDAVTNPFPASGGADPEDVGSLVERAPRTLRHGMRAVTSEDYEDLALLASTEVARAKCIPLLDPSLIRNGQPFPHLGATTVLIVPHSDDPRPMPSSFLLETVQDYLRRHGAAVADIYVAGPFYLPVDLTAQVFLASVDQVSQVELAVPRALDTFLHPLAGGFDGRGWPFGRLPHRSDLYTLLQGIPGVDHVGALDFQTPALPQDLTSLTDLQRMALSIALVCAGVHHIAIEVA